MGEEVSYTCTEVTQIIGQRVESLRRSCYGKAHTWWFKICPKISNCLLLRETMPSQVPLMFWDTEDKCFSFREETKNACCITWKYCITSNTWTTTLCPCVQVPPQAQSKVQALFWAREILSILQKFSGSIWNLRECISCNHTHLTSIGTNDCPPEIKNRKSDHPVICLIGRTAQYVLSTTLGGQIKVIVHFTPQSTEDPVC